MMLNIVMRIIRRRVITGNGIRDELWKVGKDGAERVRFGVHNGVRTIIPIVAHPIHQITDRAHKAIDVIQSKVDNLSLSGKGILKKRSPGQSIVQQLNRSLKGGMIKTF